MKLSGCAILLSLIMTVKAQGDEESDEPVVST